MAIISIPTSIGGLSIPGAVLKGPLSKLFGDDKNKIESLHYPRDLGSATKGHVVQFFIEEVKPVGFEEGKETTLKSIYEGLTKKAGSTIDVGKAGYAADGISGAILSVYDSISLKYKPMEKTTKAAISLYMPETMSFTNTSHYSNLSLKKVVEDIATFAAGGLGQAAVSLINSDAAKLALATQGLAINPQEQVLFDGIDFRNFQMTFTFTPFSAQEAADVQRIVQLFRLHAAPQIIVGPGMFFVPPSRFGLKFMFNGAENKNIPQVADCVIESIEVNYAPNGWSAHTDGAPVQTTLSIGFKEIELIDRDKISKGF